MWAGQPVGGAQTRVDRVLSSPEGSDVGVVGGEPSRDLRTLGNGAVAGHHDIDVPRGLAQAGECCLVGAHLIGLARVQERDQDV